VSLQRLLLVDVDDIFVGERGTRLKKDDVEVCVNMCQVSVHEENSFEMFARIAW
jgi:hypothetical protein